MSATTSFLGTFETFHALDDPILHCVLAFFRAASNTFFSSRSSGPKLAVARLQAGHSCRPLLQGPHRACDDVLVWVLAHSDVAPPLRRWRSTNCAPQKLFLAGGLWPTDECSIPCEPWKWDVFQERKRNPHCTDDPRESNGRLEQEILSQNGFCQRSVRESAAGFCLEKRPSAHLQNCSITRGTGTARNLFDGSLAKVGLA